jgi:hypothetical protein
MKKISWTHHVRHEEELQNAQEKMNTLQTIKEGKLTGFVTCNLGTTFYNTLLKER